MHYFAQQTTLAIRYLAAEPLRTVYLALTLTLAFASYALLAALATPFTTTNGSQSEEAKTINVSAAYGALPTRYASEIAKLPGAASVEYSDFMPVQCRSNVTATLNGMAAIGRSAIPEVRALLSTAEAQSWGKTNAMLVGDDLARRCHWKAGEFLTLKGEMGSQPTIKIRIAAIYHAGSGNPALNQVALVHYRYLDSLKPTNMQGNVQSLQVRAVSAGEAVRLATTIDTHFSAASPPTRSSVNTARQGALAQFGNVVKIVQFVMAAVFACALLVTVNVAAYAAAERRAQFAMFRVLGFTRTWIAALNVVELLYVVTLGCGLGLALGLALLRWVLAPLLGSFFAGLLSVPASALALAPAIAAGIVIVSMLLPAWEIFRVRATRLTAP
jgi:ABC-type lipoprotein release transport system permease subunit